MPSSHELAALDATAQADLVRRRELSPLELVEAAVEQLAATKDRRAKPRSAAEAERRKRGA